jgi:hypothetical protein
VREVHRLLSRLHVRLGFNTGSRDSVLKSKQGNAISVNVCQFIF